MRLSQPNGPYQGIPKEDVFFVADDRYVQLGVGFVILSMQTEMYPERPMQIYIQVDAQPSARNLLLGALLARAEQYRAMYPQLRGRIYTQLVPTQWEMINFYSHNGFANNDAEEEYIFTLPDIKVNTPPMSCQFASVPLQTLEQTHAFLARLNAYRMTPITMDYLMLQMQQPYFMALGYYRGGQPIAEILVSGSRPDTGGLVMLYCRSEYRRSGIGKSLLTSAAGLLRERGVTQCVTLVFSRNEPQIGLMKSLAASRRRIVSILPGIDIG